MSLMIESVRICCFRLFTSSVRRGVSQMSMIWSNISGPLALKGSSRKESFTCSSLKWRQIAEAKFFSLPVLAL